jgi:ubiquinone/menaquinone biosynthesis C-methylase UbiE
MAEPVSTAVAAAYDEYLVPGLFTGWARRAVELARLRPGDSVLDVACGTGIGARTALEVGTSGRIVGLDIDAGCIEYARRQSQERGDAIEWRCASAIELPFDDGSFDACLCVHGLQFFPDPVKALREMHRVLKGGGRLVALTWGALEENKGHYAAVQALEKRRIDATAAKRAFSIANGDRLRALAAQAGFANAEVRVESGTTNFPSREAFFTGMVEGSPSTRHALALVPEVDRAAFLDEVAAALQRYFENGKLRYPTSVNVLTATRQ